MVYHKFNLLILLFLFSSASAGEVPVDVLVYADRNYPPYSYEEDGVVKGIYYDIVSYAFSKMPDYNLIVKAVPWRRGLKYIEEGEGVAIYPPYKHLEDRPYINPYSVALLNEEVVVYCSEKVLKGIYRRRWPEDFYQLLFGINGGFILDERFQQAVSKNKILISEVKSTSDNLKMLILGRIDCHINSNFSIVSGLRNIKEDISYKSAIDANPIAKALMIKNQQGYLGFYSDVEGKYSFKDDLVESFNRIVSEMKEAGVVDEIVSSY